MEAELRELPEEKKNEIAETSKKDDGAGRKVDPFLFVLVLIFSWGTWIDIVSIFSQFAFLMSVLPESYGLASYLSMTIQTANVIPLFYVIGRKLRPRIFHERPAIFFILTWGIAGLMLLGFFWDTVSVLPNGKTASVVLLVLCFTLAAVDTLSTVTFLPYMSLFPAVYLAPFFIGQSFAGLIPGVLSILQSSKRVKKSCTEWFPTNSLHCPVYRECKETFEVNVGKYFSTRTFFFLMAAAMTLSWAAFGVINLWSRAKSQMVKPYKKYVNERENNSTSLQLRRFFDRVVDEWKSFDRAFCYHLFAITVVSFIGNGVVMQILPYTGDNSDNTILLSQNLYFVAGAITSMILIWKTFTDHRIIMAYTVIFSLIAGGLIAIAAFANKGFKMSPTLSKPLLIIAYIICGHIFNAVRQVVCTVASTYNTERMFIVSIFIQVGSFVGTLLMFFAVSIGCVFD